MYNSLRVVAAPGAEPVTLAQAKAHLRIDNDADDDLIEGLISAARDLIEGWLARTLFTTELTYTLSQDPPSGALPLLPMPLLVLPIILSSPILMNKPLEMPRSPVSQIEQVTYTDLDGNTTILVAGSDYVADLTVDPARLRITWITVPRWLQHISIKFKAGYSDSDATKIPPKILLAIKMMVAFLYEHRGDDGGEMPKAIEYLLTPDRLVFFGG